ncbi:MAG: rod shape-determining protein MreC [Bacteroidales bacterium]|nr:rod shape-determining protein MreC [Candidatus Cryptobacteroides aphodequi]
MSERPTRHRILSIAAVFIVLEIAAFYCLGSSSDIHNVWLNRASHRSIAFFWGGGQRIREYASLRKLNDALANENLELLEALSAYRDSVSGAGLAKRDRQFTYIPAKVVKLSHNSQHNYIILNKGEVDGIEPMDGIITSNGAVGIVDAVSENYCYGMLFTNTGLSVSARLGHSGVVAPLVWDGRSPGQAVLQGLPLTVEVSEADTVFTSGLSGIFPSDIPLGTPTRKKTSSGATNDAEVRLFTDFSSLAYVSIVKNLGRDEIETLEKREKEAGR